MTDTRCVLLFARAPEKGRVKSRLAADAGDDVAWALYKKFVFDTIATLKTASCPFRVCYHPPAAVDAVATWLGSEHPSMPQRGDDLGERMENAFRQSFSDGFDRVLLIGSDIPDLPVAVLHEALESLKTSDAVIGPAADGGYYLMGFRKDTFLPDVFRGQAWSTNTVFRDTMALFAKSAYRVHRLPGWRDVDTLEDLRALLLRNENTVYRNSQTMSYLMQHRKKIFGSRKRDSGSRPE